MAERIYAAMSGGVDSSAVAYLLREAGHEVIGATMTLYRPGMRVGPDGVFHSPAVPGELPCGPDRDAADARRICDRLGIPHRTLDMGEAFCRTVLADFVREYEAGRTPNPCTVCNRCLKFGALLEAALSDGADAIATGHYARVEHNPASGRYLIRRGVDERKDQSYFLWQLSQETLRRVRMPLGGMTKAEIRELAAAAGLETAHKSDSQDICFVPDGDYAAFLCRYTGHGPALGDFVSEDGRVLGRHQGFWSYTVGQRKGLGIALGAPMFVKAKDPATHRVVLTTGDRLGVRRVVIRDLGLVALARAEGELRCTARLRSTQRPVPVRVSLEGDRAVLLFEEEQRAPAPGQSAVLYDGDILLLGGVITGG